MSWTIVDLPNVNSPQTQGQPGITVQVRFHLWEKVVNHHFDKNPEYWKGLLGKELFEQLKQKDKKTMIAATEKILPEIAKSMATPLVLFHLVKESKARVWLCVLPCGLNVYIRRSHENGQRYLATCHPKGKAERLKRGLLSYSDDKSLLDRGKELAEVLGKHLTMLGAVEHAVRRYTNKKMTLPHTLDEVPDVDEFHNTARRIAFILPTQWGFESNTTGAQWKMPAEYPEPLWKLDPANPAKVVVEQ